MLRSASSFDLGGTLYFTMTSLSWLNVMGFEIWRKLGKLQSSPNVSIDNRQTAMFVGYSVFAWAGSTVPFIIYLICNAIPIPFVGSLYIVLAIFKLGPIVVGPVFSICLFVATGVKMVLYKINTGNQADGVNDPRNENDQSFYLYVKLFPITFILIILWIAGIIWQNLIFYVVVCILQGLQGIFFFFEFIWKDEVKRWLQGPFNAMLLRISLCFNNRS